MSSLDRTHVRGRRGSPRPYAPIRRETAQTALPAATGESLRERRYRQMLFIRRFEERVLELFESGVVNGTTHACIGQEADCVAVMEQLRRDDEVFSNHRCHGHYLAHTGDARGLLAEIIGLPEGVCAGIGGSQHLAGEHFHSNGVQGGIVAAAAGIALALKLRAADAISSVFIGDGTLGEGIVYESLNLAALWRLPLLVVLEDNGWAQSTPVAANLAGDVLARFSAFGIAVEQVDSTDVEEIAPVAARAVARVRGERVPCVLAIRTYRLCHHSKNDDDRPVEEVRARWESDPLAIQARRLDPAVHERIDGEVADAIAALAAELS